MPNFPNGLVFGSAKRNKTKGRCTRVEKAKMVNTEENPISLDYVVEGNFCYFLTTRMRLIRYSRLPFWLISFIHSFRFNAISDKCPQQQKMMINIIKICAADRHIRVCEHRTESQKPFLDKVKNNPREIRCTPTQHTTQTHHWQLVKWMEQQSTFICWQKRTR